MKREQHIKTLFHTGKAFSAFPLKCMWLLRSDITAGPDMSPVRIAFSVPKKRFARAVDRNRIKRLMRESWRHQKHVLYPLVAEGVQLHLFFIFTGNKGELPDHPTVYSAVEEIVQHLQRKLHKDA
ncbi:ribonuclease P protein component [Rurimicrobium arvi]